MSITWNGVSSDTIGVIVERIPNRYVPTRRFSPQQVAGRNGNILLVDKSFPNVEQEYEVYLSAEAQGLPSVARACAEWLMGPDGYCRLEDSYDTTVYREAFLMGGYDLENILNKFGRCTITFSCKPQKYLLTGDTPIEIPAGITTYTGDVVQFDGVTGASITSLSTTITPTQDLHGYSHPWPAGGGKNKLKYPYASGSSVSANNVTYTVNSNGSITIATNGTASAQTDFYFCGAASTYESIGLPSGTYTFSVKSSASITTGTLQVFLFEDGVSLMGQNISGTSWSASATISDTASYRFFLRVASGKSVNTMIEPQAEAGSTPTEWSPYSNICPITGRTGVSVYDDPKYGGTVAWNQLIENGNFASTTRWSVSSGDSLAVSNNKAVYRASARYHNIVQGTAFTSQEGHVYFGLVTVKGYTNTGIVFYIRNVSGGTVVQTATKTLTTQKQRLGNMIKVSANGSQLQYMFQDNNTSDYGDIELENAQLFDLTQMFGSTIADYIYSLERSTAGAGVAWFRNLFPKDYYPYDNSYTETCVSAVNGDPYWKTSIDWTTPAGTVYGGTLDVVTGVLTVTHALKVLNGSEAWGAGAQNQGFYTQVNDLIKTTNYKGKIISDKLKTFSRNVDADYGNGEYGITGYYDYNTYPNQNWIYAKAAGIATVNDFKTWLSSNPITVVYELATPLTYQLTPTQVAVLTGTNNVWTSSGPVSVTVVAPFVGTVTNPTPFEARPLLEVSGVGEITINGKTIQILESVSDFEIDCETMEAEDNSKIYCMDFPDLSGGENEIAGDGSITALTVTPRWWTL